MSTLQESAQAIYDHSATLRSEIPNLLEQQSPELIQQEMIKRDEFKNEIQREYNKIKDMVNDLEALARKLREVKADQTHDNKKLDARRWDLITERKHHNA